MQRDFLTLSAHDDGARRGLMQNKPNRIFVLNLLVKSEHFNYPDARGAVRLGLSLITLWLFDCLRIILWQGNLSFLCKGGLEFYVFSHKKK